MHRNLSILLVSICISGCLSYPVHKKIQPRSHIQVVDELGRPLSDAEVHLVASSYPHPEEEFRMIKKTRSTGILVFPEIKEWRIESLHIHGSAHYFWNWCIRKEGYETQDTHQGTLEFSRKMKVVLKEGSTSECPKGGRQIIHNKFKNEYVSKLTRTPHKTRRPF